MNVISYHSGRNPRLYQQTSRTVYRTVAVILDSEHAVLPNRKSLYIAWFQNHRKQIIHYRCEAFRLSTFPYSRDVRSPCFVQFAQYGLKHSCFLFVSRLPHEAHFFICSQNFFPRNLILLCLSKYTRLLKVLLHDSHGIRTSENAHGGTDNHYTTVRIYVSRPYSILYYKINTRTVLSYHLQY